MHKLFIPPSLIFYCIALMAVLAIFLSQYNFILFPYNLGGLIIALLGFLTMGKARDLFSKHETTLKIKESTHLINDGVFAKTRNPMYLGMSILLFGLAICSMNVFSLILPFIFSFLIGILFIPKEEKLMQDSFGEEYLEYRKKVRRWI